MRDTVSGRFAEVLRVTCNVLDMPAGRITKFDGGTARPMYVHDPLQQTLGEGHSNRLAEFTKLVASDSRHVHFQDLSTAQHMRHCAKIRQSKGSYIGTPLLLHGVLFGVLEFWSDKPRPNPWGAEELSILSAVSMFTTTQLRAVGQPTNHGASERMRIQKLMDERMIGTKF